MRKTHDILASIFNRIGISKLSSVHRLPGGFNCAVYKIVDKEGHTYIAKQYIIREHDPTDRLTVEFGSISFLWKHGITAIPRPIFASPPDHVGIYQYIYGSAIAKGEYSYLDIIEIANFTKDVHSLANVRGSRVLPPAKEACFRIIDSYQTVDRRLTDLRSVPKRAETKKLHEFLENEFLPFFVQVRQFTTVGAKRARIDITSSLPQKCRTLSSSDFGFHNAIRTKSGNLTFIDFEYFGWDDPAKMIADFFLHPKMSLPYKLREYFYKQVIGIFADPLLPQRVALTYAILSLKWCLIMLNAFTRRRGSVSATTLKRQLAKSRTQLNETIAELEMRSFPLSLLT